MAKPVGAATARIINFDAGKSERRLRGIPTAQAAINTQIRAYGKTILARSRYLASNNPYAAAAKETFVSALVGDGIAPSPLLRDQPDLKDEIQLTWNDWIEEADADGRGDFYGLQQLIAAELFEAGECFIRFRQRRATDGLVVPLQLQVIPSEMLPLDASETRRGGRTLEMGIEFDRIGRRTAYEFLPRHPDSDEAFNIFETRRRVRVPASEVLHLYRRVRAGQIRGLPHTLSAITKLALLDQYDDAELERKRIAALFAVFVTRPLVDDNEHPFESANTPADGDNPVSTTADEAGKTTAPDNSWALEPGAAIDLEDGEQVQFSNPADVGGNYEAFQYRNLLAVASGMGVPYAAMTGDLRQTSFGSLRGGLIEFRRRIQSLQQRVMVFQFAKPVWKRWFREAVLSGAVPVTPADFSQREREFNRVTWIPPKWEWIDPLKDRQAEKLAVDEGWKARSDVIVAEGGDPEETDRRIAADQERAGRLGLTFGQEPPEPEEDEMEDDDNDDSGDDDAPPVD